MQDGNLWTGWEPLSKEEDLIYKSLLSYKWVKTTSTTSVPVPSVLTVRELLMKGMWVVANRPLAASRWTSVRKSSIQTPSRTEWSCWHTGWWPSPSSTPPSYKPKITFKIVLWKQPCYVSKFHGWPCTSNMNFTAFLMVPFAYYSLYIINIITVKCTQKSHTKTSV